MQKKGFNSEGRREREEFCPRKTEKEYFCVSPQLFTLDWASSIKDGHSHKLDGEAGERGGVLFSREKRRRVLLVAEEACFYCQE